ncbi:MAG: TolC family protein [Prolixibacteraceae bacterium]|nr:TolC family protein [Prolixibacteraceae bacterium]
MKKFILLLFLPVQVAFGQQEITLKECYHWARENYPNLKQSEIYSGISGLKVENLKTNFLPSATLKGQATYQSEVTKIDIPIPNIDVPCIAKDQYKIYLEFQQTIWDGGLTESQRQLEESILKTTLSQLETEIYQLNEKVNQAWFAAISANKTREILETQKNILNEKLKSLESGIKNGVIEISNADVLKAEILNTDQTIIEIQSGYQTAIKILSLITGKELDNAILKTEPVLKSNVDLNRPELALFESQADQLDNKAILLEKARNPKIFGFGQGGIGRPGLNMLSNDFNPYYLVGVGISWNPFDWQKTKREKQIIGMQKDLILAQQETFEQNILILLEQQLETIQKTEKLIETDQQIIILREKIADVSASKLKNGTINSADYVTDLNAATIAMLKLETHKIQLEEATIKYNTIKGI